MSIYKGPYKRPSARFECDECMTINGCEEHRVFRCESCSKPTWWKDGGADDCPNDCSDCWLAWWNARAQLAHGLALLIDGSIGPMESH